MVTYAFNPSTREAEAGGSEFKDLLELVPGQAPKLQRNPVIKNTTKTKVNK